MKGLLLAAGLGTRFRPHTEKLPKPVLPLLNIPIAFYNLHLMQQLELDSLVVNTHHLPEKIKETFSKYNEVIHTPTHFSDEKGKILGTGGAIKKARQQLSGSGTFVMANADVVNGFAVTDALEFHHKERPMATLVVIKHPEAGKKYGAVWVNSKNEVIDIGREKPTAQCKPYHFVGVHLIEESIFKYIPAGPCEITSDVYLSAIKKGEKVLVFEKKGLWFDAGTLEDYLVATEKILGLLPKIQHQPFFLSLFRRFWPNFDKRPNLWEGLACEHLLPLGSSSKILMGQNCVIDPSVVVKGFAVFGDNVIVESGVELTNVVINSGARVKKGLKLKNDLIL